MTITISSASGAAVLGVDDERAVEALGDVLGQRPDVAVVEVQAERLRRRTRRPCVSPGAICPAPSPGTPSISARVDAVEVDRVRVRGAVDERDPQPLALAAAQRRAGDAAVVGPGRELDAGRDLDLLVDRRSASTRAATRPLGSRRVLPQSKSRRISCGSKPLAAWSTLARRGSRRGRRRPASRVPAARAPCRPRASGSAAAAGPQGCECGTSRCSAAAPAPAAEAEPRSLRRVSGATR